MAIEERVHPTPFRTRKLSSPSPMILHNVMWESRPLPKIARKPLAAQSARGFLFLRLRCCLLLEGGRGPLWLAHKTRFIPEDEAARGCRRFRLADRPLEGLEGGFSVYRISLCLSTCLEHFQFEMLHISKHTAFPLTVGRAGCVALHFQSCPPFPAPERFFDVAAGSTLSRRQGAYSVFRGRMGLASFP